jgi:hypothetical protein
MPDPIEVAGGEWIRFERYEVRDGYIRPVEGAQFVTYDPWRMYRAARASRAEQAPPYQSLLALLQGLPLLDQTPESEARIAAWCTENGLLGLLPQRVQMVALYPRFVPLPPLFRVMDQDGKPAQAWWPAQSRYYRTGTGWWHELTTGGPPAMPIASDAPDLEGALIPDGVSLPGQRPPSVVIQELQAEKWVVEPLGQTWAHFFPSVPETEWETFAYPQPQTAEFWHLYAEPVPAFLEGALALYQALDRLQRLKPVSQMTPADWGVVRPGMDTLNALVAPVRTALLATHDGAWRQEWLAPSLLASFSMMALEDLSEHRRIRSCETCGVLFTSAAYQARYCSARCRQTAQKRGYRKRRNAASGR